MRKTEDGRQHKNQSNFIKVSQHKKRTSSEGGKNWPRQWGTTASGPVTAPSPVGGNLILNTPKSGLRACKIKIALIFDVRGSLLKSERKSFIFHDKGGWRKKRKRNLERGENNSAQFRKLQIGMFDGQRQD